MGAWLGILKRSIRFNKDLLKNKNLSVFSSHFCPLYFYSRYSFKFFGFLFFCCLFDFLFVFESFLVCFGFEYFC